MPIRPINEHKIQKPQGPVLVVSLLMLYALLSGSCVNKMSDLPFHDDQGAQNGDKATDVTFLFSEKGTVKAKLRSNEFVANDAAKPPYTDFLHGIKLEMFDSSGQVVNTVTARSARYYTQEQNIIARDSVVVSNQKGESLQTEELIWNQNLQRFYTDKQVRITFNGEVTWGEGFEAAQDFSWFRIKKQRGSLPVGPGDLPIDE